MEVGLQQFNCLVPIGTIEKIKMKGIRYRRIVELGLTYLDERTELHNELKSLRFGNDKLQRLVTSQGGRILELEKAQ